MSKRRSWDISGSVHRLRYNKLIIIGWKQLLRDFRLKINIWIVFLFRLIAIFQGLPLIFFKCIKTFSIYIRHLIQKRIQVIRPIVNPNADINSLLLLIRFLIFCVDSLSQGFILSCKCFHCYWKAINVWFLVSLLQPQRAQNVQAYTFITDCILAVLILLLTITHIYILIFFTKYKMWNVEFLCRDENYQPTLNLTANLRPSYNVGFL